MYNLEIGDFIMKTNKKIYSSKRASFAALIVIFLLLQGILEFGFGLSLFVFGLNPNFIRLILIIVLIIFPLFDGTPATTKQDKINRILYTVFATILILGGVFFYMLGFSDDKYFSFKNPSGNKTLVVSERSAWFYGNSTFYVRKYGIFIKDINQSIGTDDGFRPFSTNQYSIEWIDDYNAVINYDFGGSGSQWFTTTVKLK